MHFLNAQNVIDAKRPLDVKTAYDAIQILRDQISKCSAERDESRVGIVGQEDLVDNVLIALMVGEHCLLEGNPGLAKTMVSKTTGQMAGLVFSRIQFMPDMMPSDLVLREILVYQQDHPTIVTKMGPIFTNVLLADEMNRASPKTQSALLEATEEGYVTPLGRKRRVVRPVTPFDECILLTKYGPFFGFKTRVDPDTMDAQVFVVFATQNPIEQEGVYPLSKAQEDRFMFKLIIDYPPGKDLGKIARHFFDSGEEISCPPVSEEDHVKTLYFFWGLRRLLLGPEAAENWDSDRNRDLRERIETLINFSHIRPFGNIRSQRKISPRRNGSDIKLEELKWTLAQWAKSRDSTLRRRAALLQDRLADSDMTLPEVLSGSSPRGFKLIRAAHARALLNGHFEDGRVQPTWDDCKQVATAVLRHRIRLTPGFEAMGVKADTVIEFLIEWIDQW